MILKNWKGKDFKKFRRQFHPLRYPLIFELRSHAEIRDSNLQKAERTEDPIKKKQFLLAAFKENLIIDKYYSRTAATSSYS